LTGQGALIPVRRLAREITELVRDTRSPLLFHDAIFHHHRITTMQKMFSRRVLIDSALKVFPFFIALDLGIRTAAAATLAPLDPNDPTAKALAYVDSSAKPDQTCANCAQFQVQAANPRGGCNIFAGKSVAAGGWCSVWAKKT
jgi:hypothetical protein